MHFTNKLIKFSEPVSLDILFLSFKQNPLASHMAIDYREDEETGHHRKRFIYGICQRVSFHGDLRIGDVERYLKNKLDIKINKRTIPGNYHDIEVTYQLFASEINNGICIYFTRKYFKGNHKSIMEHSKMIGKEFYQLINAS